MNNKKTDLCRRQRQNLFLTFGIGILLVLGVSLLLRMWPFGDITLLTGDLNGQYVAYITDMKRRLGEGGFLYSFAKLCGGSTLGMLAYYMVSPFNLIFLLLPGRMIPEAVQLIFLLRTALTATAMCFFLQKHFDSDSRLLPFLSQSYGLCAFCVVYSQNIIWMDVVLLAPLMLWALEHLVDTGRPWPMFWLTAASVLLNFYTAWSVCLFSVLYFLYYWVVSTKLENRTGRLFANRLARFAGSGILGAGSAMALILPAVVEIEETKGSLFSLELTFATNFQWKELPYRLFFGNFFWEDVTHGLPNIYCGVFCVALGLVFFLSPAVRAKAKLAGAGLLGVMLLSCWAQDINLIWHGFKEPVWFPYRYSFLISLILILFAAQSLLNARPRVWVLAAAGGIGLAWLIGYALTAGETFSVLKLAVSAVVFFGTLLALWLLGAKRTGALAGSILMAALMLGDVAANSFLSLRKFELYTRSGFREFYEEGTEAVNAVRRKDADLYRIERNFFRTLNDPMLLGYWGISHFSSAKASAAKPMLEQMGYVNYNIYGWGATAAADSLLGIRYLFANGSRQVPAPYEKLDLGTRLEIYQNPYALPMAYVGSKEALLVDADESADAFQLQNQMYASLVPGSSPVLLPAEDGTFTDGGKGISFEFTAPVSGPCFMAIPDTGILLPADVRLDGELLGEYFKDDSLGGVWPLGNLEKGQKAQLWLGFEDKPEYREKLQVYSLDEAALAAVTETLRANAPKEPSIWEGGRIDLTASAGENTDLLVLPFAYEDETHWQTRVNGKPVEAQPVFGGMLGVPLEEGENTVQMRYRHPAAGMGALLSAVSLAAAFGWYWLERKKKPRAQSAS